MYLTEEKDELARRLDRTRDGLMAAVAGLTEVQSNFKPSPDGWSISGIVEHLAIVEDLVILRVEQLAAGSGDSPNNKFNEPDAVLFERVVDRSEKFQAPERARPTGKTLTSSLENRQDEALQEYRRAIGLTTNTVEQQYLRRRIDELVPLTTSRNPDG